MSSGYTEDEKVEQPAIDLFWQSNWELNKVFRASVPTPEDVFTTAYKSANLSSDHKGVSSAHNEPSSAHLKKSPAHNVEPDRNEKGRLITTEFDYPVIDSLEKITDDFKKELYEIANLPRNMGRLEPGLMNRVLLDLCKNQYITLNILAKIVDRNPNSIRQRYIKKLIDENRLKMAFPSTPNHERQAYITYRKR